MWEKWGNCWCGDTAEIPVVFRFERDWGRWTSSADCALKRSPQCSGVSDCRKPQRVNLPQGNSWREEGRVSQEFPLSFCLFCLASGIETLLRRRKKWRKICIGIFFFLQAFSSFHKSQNCFCCLQLRFSNAVVSGLPAGETQKGVAPLPQATSAAWALFPRQEHFWLSHSQ